MIVARDLTKHYGAAQAVRGICFTVHRGEVVGFLGPNGAGKSTTMKMLTGFLRPTAGSAQIAGYDMASASLQARACIGYLPENAPLYEEMMVVDFLRFAAQMRDLEGDKLDQRMRHVVDRCGLKDVLGKDINQLSRGYRQRVGIAQALIHDPQLLILDEPTSGLDPNQIVEIRALIRDLGRDKTVLLSTHILSEVQAVCSRAIIINQGTLVADDTPEALVQGGDVTTVAITLKGRGGAPLSAADADARIRALPGVVQVDVQAPPSADAVSLSVRGNNDGDLRELLFEAAIDNAWCVLEMRREKKSLEETFQRLTQGTPNPQGDRHAA
jgi:ABC-2 type transport system ATP-binding protein